MILNNDKCQIVHFCTAKKPLVLSDITLNGSSICTVDQVKLLGVTLSGVTLSFIRPVLEYCAPVFHAGLTAQQAKQLEKKSKSGH